MSVTVDGPRFRVDVFTDDWERIIARKLSSPRKMLVAKGRVEVDGKRYRVDVFTNLWDDSLNRMEKVTV